MACLDHTCRVCGEMWADNDQTSSCPYCGSDDKVTFFDEPPEPHPEDEEWEEENDGE